MKKIKVEDVKIILNRIPSKCIKSIEIMPGKNDGNTISESRFKKKPQVRYYDGESLQKTSVINYKNIMGNNFNDWWGSGSMNYITEDIYLKRLPYIKIRLYNLKGIDIRSSVDYTWELNIWNDGNGNIDNDFKDLKEFILSDRKISDSENYYLFKEN